MAATFIPDQQGQAHAMVQKLMEDPITQLEQLLKGLGPAELNSKARGFCAQFNALMSKYPFRSNAQQQATLAEVNAIFKPKEGALWTFYESSLQPLLALQGTQFAPKPGPPDAPALTPQFVAFLNRAAAFSAALYPAGAVEPRLSYSLTPLKTEGIESITLSIDGQTLRATGAGGSPAKFTWPGTATRQAKMTGRFGAGTDLDFLAYDGLWAAFQLLGEAERFQPSGAGYNLEWVIKIAGRPVTLPNGAPLTVRYFLDMGGAPPFFQKGYFANMACVANAAR
jgi:type VI protein secretion system component VasK